MIALDTNILVYAYDTTRPEHTAAKDAIRRASMSHDGFGTALMCLAEFWSVATHPRLSKQPSAQAAYAFYQTLRAAGLRIWYPKNGFSNRILQTAVAQNLLGSSIFDLQIALLALEHHATEMWTHDKNFIALFGLRVVDPLT